MRSIKPFEQRTEDWASRSDERVKLGKRSIRSTEILGNKTFELCNGTKRRNIRFNFMNRIGGRSNTSHPPTTK